MTQAPLRPHVPHLKLRTHAGEYVPELCEYQRCTVAVDGRTDCGRVACPACGGAGLLVATTGWDGGLATCSCGETYTLSR